MTNFGISPPRAVLGLLRTDPRVKVAFDALFAPVQIVPDVPAETR